MRKWLSLPKRESKQSIFIKFTLSYLLILFIPIAIGAHQYYQTQQVLVEDATELNLQILRMSQDIVDRLFLETDDLVSALSVDNEILNLLQSTNVPPTPEQMYSYSLLRSSLNRYVITNKLFRDIFICMNNSQWVVTTKTSFDLSDNYIRIGGQPFKSWMDEVSMRSNQKQYYNLNDVSFEGGVSNKLIAYFSPLPNGFQGKVQGSILVFIDQNDIASLFNRLVVKNGGFAYIRDNQGHLIAQTFSSEMKADGIELPGEFTLKTGSYFEILNGKNMLVSYSRSDQNGWTYIAAMPSSVVLAKAEYIKRMILAITSVTLGLGVIAALYMAYRNSKPLSELTASMKELNSRMEQQLPLLQTSVLERLLKGYYKQEEKARTVLSQGRMALRGDAYFAISASIYKEDMPFDAYSGAEEAQSIMRNLIDRLLDGYDYWINLGGEKADLIVSIAASEADFQRDKLKERWLEDPSLFEDDKGTRLTLGVGRWTNRLSEVWRSHNEARQAMEYHVWSDRGSAIWYEDRGQGSSYYYYPLDLELKLIHTVKNGDLDGVEHLLKHLGEENFTERRLNGSKVKQFLNEIHGTLQKLLEQMEFGSDTFTELSGKLAFLRKTEADFSWSSLKTALCTVCNHIAANKKQKYNKMAESMMEIVHGRFTDANFSLTDLAGQFKLSESFISVLFKEHVGEYFSDYLEKIRMDQACVLLKETDQSINDIAFEVGYNSDKTFRRAFKRALGIQPTSYRDSLKS